MHEEERNSNLPDTVEEQPRSQSDLGEAWREVGEQVQQLGSKLADAIRRSWASSGSEPETTAETEETMQRLRDDLRAAADRVDAVIRQAREETTEERASTMQATRRASQQSLEEARSLTATTLRKLNTQLDHLVQRLEREDEQTEEEKDRTE